MWHFICINILWWKLIFLSFPFVILLAVMLRFRTFHLLGLWRLWAFCLCLMCLVSLHCLCYSMSLSSLGRSFFFLIRRFHSFAEVTSVFLICRRRAIDWVRKKDKQLPLVWWLKCTFLIRFVCIDLDFLAVMPRNQHCIKYSQVYSKVLGPHH